MPPCTTYRGDEKKKAVSIWVDGSVTASAYLTLTFMTYPSSSWSACCRITNCASSHSGVKRTPSRDRLRLQVGGLEQGGGGCVRFEIRPIPVVSRRSRGRVADIVTSCLVCLPGLSTKFS